MKSRTALLLALSAVSSVFSAESSNLPIVDLGYRFQQAVDHGVNETQFAYYEFFNIRYASPPLGPDRFSAPKPPQNEKSSHYGPFNGSEGVLACPQAIPRWNQNQFVNMDAYFNGQPFPPQKNDPTTTGEGTIQSEDCLFLDVYTPKQVFQARQTKKVPVFVWIHGGGFVGSQKRGFGSPSGLLAKANEDVIFVAINYRLGAFGFLSGPNFESQSGLPNAALADQRFALEWVRNNIALFGGDPNMVTVAGESAGATSVLHQITAFGGNTKSPFQQAIMQSPSFLPLATRETQDQTFSDFLNYVNERLPQGKKVTCLEDLRTNENITAVLMEANFAQVQNASYGKFVYGPTVDGRFVPALPGKLLGEGKYDKSLNVLASHNGNEGVEFTTPLVTDEASFRSFIQQILSTTNTNVVDDLSKRLYPPIFDGSHGYTTQFERAFSLMGEVRVTCNMEFVGHAFDKKFQGYIFNVPPAIHGQDVGYTFYTQGVSKVAPLRMKGNINTAEAFTTVYDVGVAETMQGYVANFTRFSTLGSPLVDRVESLFGGELVRIGAGGINNVDSAAMQSRCAYIQTFNLEGRAPNKRRRVV